MSDAKVKYLFWDSIKQAVKRNRLVDSVRWWFSRRKIQSLTRELGVTRRSFFGTPLLLLAPYSPAPRPPAVVRELIISEYIKTAAGRAKLAQSMIQPLRERRAYAAIGRKVFTVDQVGNG